MFKAEYLTSWDSFFEDIWLPCTQSDVYLPLFLNILKTIDFEVVNRDINRSVADLALNTQIVRIICLFRIFLFIFIHKDKTKYQQISKKKKKNRKTK
jgi:hypothetical protein